MGCYNYSWTTASGVSVGTQGTVNVTPVNSSTYYYLTVSDNCRDAEEIMILF